VTFLCFLGCGGLRLQVAEGMKVFTKNQEITDTVRGNLSLMRLKHPNVCSTCSVSALLRHFLRASGPLSAFLARTLEAGFRHAYSALLYSATVLLLEDAN